MRPRVVFIAVGVLLLTGGAAFVGHRARTATHAESAQAPWFERTGISNRMPEYDAYRRIVLERDLGSKRRWSEDEIRLVMAVLAAPDPGMFPEGTGEMTVPRPDASDEDVRLFLSLPKAEALLRWHFQQNSWKIAWAIVSDRMHKGFEVPDDIRTMAVNTWVDYLDSPDPQKRIIGANRLLYTREIDDDAVRFRLDVLRHGDPSPDVRRVVARAWQGYDAASATAQDPPVGECNTCP